MLLSLAIDPFTQQVIGSRECPVRQDSLTASIPRTERYTATGGRITTRYFALDVPMQSAMYNGIYNPIDPIVPFECRTGNCTFPVTAEGGSYSTVGMCSACVDLKDKVISDTTSENCNSSSSMCRAIPNGPILDLSSGELMKIEPSHSSQSFPEWMQNSTIAAFKMIATSVYPCSRFTYGGTCTPNPGGVAVHCGLYPCVKTYIASINAGKLKETVQKTTPMTYLEQLDPVWRRGQSLQPICIGELSV